MAPAAVLERARRALHERRDAGLAAGMGFTYRNPDRSTDPDAGRRRRPVDHRRRPLVPRRRRAAAAARLRRPASPATPGSTTTRPLRAGLRAIARRLRAAGRPGRRLRRRQLDRRPRGRPPRRARLVRQERQPPAARRRAAGSCSAASSPPPTYPPADAGRRRLRHVPALPRRLPDRAPSSPPASSTPTAAWPGCCRRPGTIPVELRAGASATGIYGCDDCQEACPPTVRLGRRHRRAARRRTPRRGSTCSTCSPPTTRTLLDRHGRWYIAGRDPRWLRRNALVVLGNTADAERPAGRRRRSPATAHGDDADPRRARPLGAASGSALARRGSPGVKHLLVTNDFPPKIGGIQSLLWEWWRRLPPDRFAVLTSPYAGAAAVRRRPAVPHRADAASRCCCRTRGWCGASTSSPREVGADLVVLDPAVPLGAGRPVAAAAVRRRAARRRGHRARPAARARKQALGTRAAPRPPRRSPPAATRPPRPSGPPGGRCRSRSCRPASTSSASARSTTPSGAAARRALRAARRRRADRVDLPARAAQGLRRRHRGRRPAGAAAAPTSCWRSPAAAATSAACAGWPPSAARRCGSSGASPTTTCPALYGCADVFAMPCRNRWGGLEQEGFGIVFVEAAACGVPQVAGDSGGAAEAVDDGVTGLVVRRPDDPDERRRRRSRRCSTTRRSGPRWATASRRAGRRRVLLRRARRAPRARRSACGDVSRERAPSRRRDAGDVLVARRPRRHRAVRRHRRARRRRSSRRSGSGSPPSRRSCCSPSACSPSCGRTTTPCSAAARDEIGVAKLYLLLGPPTPAPVRRTMLGAAGRAGRRSPRSTTFARPRRARRQARVVARPRLPRADVRLRPERAVGGVPRRLPAAAGAEPTSDERRGRMTAMAETASETITHRRPARRGCGRSPPTSSATRTGRAT